jgi:proteasome lid subunit RPN8/RPN11
MSLIAWWTPKGRTAELLPDARPPRAGATRSGRRVSPARLDPATGTLLAVHPAVLSTIRSAVERAGANETGGPLLGTVERTWDGERFRLVASLLGTVPPGPALDGRPSSVAMGVSSDGERAASAIRWWRDVTGLELLHFGDWHCHPMGHPEPSAGDRTTAHEMRALAATPVWVAAIAVDAVASEEDAAVKGNAAVSTVTTAHAHEVRFYLQCAPGGLVPMRVRVEADVLPKLPPLPWHILDPARFAAECRLLHAAGFAPAIEQVVAGSRLGMTLQVRRDDGWRLTVQTGMRHPYEEPTMRDEEGRQVAPLSPWSPARFLVDLVKEVEW